MEMANAIFKVMIKSVLAETSEQGSTYWVMIYDKVFNFHE